MFVGENFWQNVSNSVLLICVRHIKAATVSVKLIISPEKNLLHKHYLMLNLGNLKLLGLRLW